MGSEMCIRDSLQTFASENHPCLPNIWKEFASGLTSLLVEKSYKQTLQVDVKLTFEPWLLVKCGDVFASLKSSVRRTLCDLCYVHISHHKRLITRGHFVSLIEVSMRVIYCNPVQIA